MLCSSATTLCIACDSEYAFQITAGLRGVVTSTKGLIAPNSDKACKMSLTTDKRVD